MTYVTLTQLGSMLQVYRQLSAGGLNRFLRFPSAAVTDVTMDSWELATMSPQCPVSMRVPVFIDGGAGDDVLAAGGGNAILLGGAGKDQLFAGAGRNLLIGGAGSDVLSAGLSGGSILIGGSTSHDANDVALRAILAEWSSSRSLSERIANLTDGSGSPSPSQPRRLPQRQHAHRRRRRRLPVRQLRARLVSGARRAARFSTGGQGSDVSCSPFGSRGHVARVPLALPVHLLNEALQVTA